MPYLSLTEKSKATTKPWSNRLRPGNGVGLFGDIHTHFSYLLTCSRPHGAQQSVAYQSYAWSLSFDYVSSCGIPLMPVVYQVWDLGAATAATRIVTGGA